MKGSKTAEPIKFSNLDKRLYPSGFTKGQVIDYYRQVAPFILPHLKDRALTLKRYPNGTDQPFFYEKRCPPFKPKWMKTASVPSQKEAGKVIHCMVADVDSLLWVANLASLELHVLLARADHPNRPTHMVFDLDPGAPATLLDCVSLALKMRQSLQSLGLESFVKSSGNKGIHLYVPLNTAVTFEQTKAFSRAIAEWVQKDDPERITTNMSKALRKGKIFIDWSQNDLHKTTVCVYSLRAIESPMVSMPLSWEELSRAQKSKSTDGLRFDAPAALKRVAKVGDLFEPLLHLRQNLPQLPD